MQTELQIGAPDMPLKRVQAKLKFLNKVRAAIEKAKEAGVHDPVGLVRRALDSRLKYKVWKQSNKR